MEPKPFRNLVRERAGRLLERAAGAWLDGCTGEAVFAVERALILCDIDDAYTSPLVKETAWHIAPLVFDNGGMTL